MRLKFTKDAGGNITVKFAHEDETGSKEAEFSYIKLINVLYQGKHTFDEPEFIGDISEHEKEKIKEMITQINEAAITKLETTK